MVELPYAIDWGPVQFVGTYETDGPSTQGEIFYSGIPAGNYSLANVDDEVILCTVDRTQKLGFIFTQTT